MKIESVTQWLESIHLVVEEAVYERKDEFLFCLLVILAGKNLELRGEAGVGKSFFAALLEPLRAFNDYPLISEVKEQSAWISLAITPLKEQESFKKIALHRGESYTLPLPEFLPQRALELASQLPFDAGVMEILLESQGQLKLSAQAWRDAMDLLAVSAYYNQRISIGLHDLPVLHRLGFVVELPSVQDDKGVEKDLTLLELDVENQLRQHQMARKLRKFSLMIKGQESETCRFLYGGEESHMLLSSYQQLLIHREKFISVSFYQPSGYGLAARPFRESFRLFDDFTLVDSSGHHYELLTEQVTPLRRLSLLSKQYLQAQLDAILQRILEMANSKDIEIENCFLSHPIDSGFSNKKRDQEMMERIKIIKSKLEG